MSGLSLYYHFESIRVVALLLRGAIRCDHGTFPVFEYLLNAGNIHNCDLRETSIQF